MNIRSRVAAWLRRRRRVRAAKKQAPLREFVYLDDVSVFSLIASRLGPVAAEFTDIETASLQSEIEATGGVGAPPFKAEAKSRLQSTRGRESQVLRKSIVQTTFKELYELEQSRLLLRPAEPDEERPNLADAAGLEVWAAKSGSPWTVSSDRLTRGQLVEVEVELDPEPIFQMSTVMSTMLDIARDAPEIAQTGGYEQLGQIESVGRVLEKLLAGLIPVRGRALDYAAVDVGGYTAARSQGHAREDRSDGDLPTGEHRGGRGRSPLLEGHSPGSVRGIPISHPLPCRPRRSAAFVDPGQAHGRVPRHRAGGCREPCPSQPPPRHGWPRQRRLELPLP